MTSISITIGDNVLKANFYNDAISQQLMFFMPFEINLSRWDNSEYFSTPFENVEVLSNAERYLLSLKATLFIKNNEIQLLLPMYHNDKDFIVSKIGEIESNINQCAFESKSILAEFILNPLPYIL